MSILAAFTPNASTACCSMSVIHRSVYMFVMLAHFFFFYNKTDDSHKKYHVLTFVPFYVFVVRYVLQETAVRTSVSLSDCMQRQKW